MGGVRDMVGTGMGGGGKCRKRVCLSLPRQKFYVRSILIYLGLTGLFEVPKSRKL